MEKQVFWIIKLSVKNGQVEEASELMNEMVAATQKNEPGALNYEWFFNEDRTTCHIYERYRDSAAVLTHLKNFGEHFGERFLSIFEPTGLTVYGEPSNEAQKALNDLGATYFQPAAGFVR